MIVSNQDFVVALVGIVVSMVLMFLAGHVSALILIGNLGDKVLNSPVVVAYLKHLADSASPELLHVLNTVKKLADETIPPETPETPPVGGGTNAAG